MQINPKSRAIQTTLKKSGYATDKPQILCTMALFGLSSFGSISVLDLGNTHVSSVLDKECGNPLKILQVAHGYLFMPNFNLFRPYARTLKINVGVTEPLCPSSMTLLNESLSLLFPIICVINLNIETGWPNLVYQGDQGHLSLTTPETFGCISEAY